MNDSAEMKCVILVLIFTLASITATATSIARIPLEELVARADYIFVGKITRVAMFDGKGREITEPDARTGPGSNNQLRFFVRVDRSAILKSTEDPIPQDIVVPLWNGWHFDLAYVKQAEGRSKIFLLKANSFEEVHPSGCRRELVDRAKVERLVEQQGKNQALNQPSQPTPLKRRG